MRVHRAFGGQHGILVGLANHLPSLDTATGHKATEAAGVMIHPHIGRIGFDLFSGQRASTSGGIGQYNQQTKGFEEYLGIREFRDTDSFHWVHWKSSARLNKLMVKEMAEYHANQITIILDLRIDVKNIKQRDALETAICFVATLIERATERSLPIALILRGHKIKTMRHGQGAGHRWSLMTELAIVEMAVIDDSDSGVGGIYPKSFRDAHRWTVGVGIIDRYSDVAGYRGSSSLIDVLEDKLNIFGHNKIGKSQSVNWVPQHLFWRKPLLQNNKGSRSAGSSLDK